MKTKGTFLILGLLMASGTASAEPTLYPPDLNVLSSIKNMTDSNIMADEKDSKTVWVLPPNTAEATVSGLHSPTANMIFCQDLVIARKNAAAQNERIEALNKQLFDKNAELMKAQDVASNLLMEAEKYSTENGLAELQGYDDRIIAAESRLSKLYEEYSKCKQECYGIKTEIGTTNEDKRQAVQARAEFLAKNSKDLREYKRRRALADAAQKKVDDVYAAFEKIQTVFQKAREAFMGQFRSFSVMSGAKANMSYRSHWDQNLTTLRNANPGFNFSKVAAKNAKLMGELASVGGLDPQGAIQYIAYGGADNKGIVSYTEYPQDLDANIALSLLGACPLIHAKEFDVEGIGQVGAMKYGIVITYEYDSIFTMKATATYNMYKMYQKIVSSGSSGGLFSSRSWSSVEERNFFRDSFSVKWEDQENTVPQNVKDEREVQMRHNVLERLATLALPAVPNRAEVLPAGQAPTRGAIVAANELTKACPGNAYCLAGAAVLRVLDAIFGSSSSSSSYTQITDTVITENYANTQKVTKSWITSYVDPKKSASQTGPK